MASKLKRQKRLKNLFNSRRVVELSDLYEAIETNSRMTVFRRLQRLNYVSSYTHAGRYYTLYEIAQFDRDGLWFYSEVGFSQKGSLKKTIKYMVNACDAGKLHSEFEKQLRVRVHNALLDLVKSNKINRTRFEGNYLYTSIDPNQSKRQIERRYELKIHPNSAWQFLSESMVIEVLVEVIRAAGGKPDFLQIVSSLKKRGVSITINQVKAVFKRYGIEKKISGFL